MSSKDFVLGKFLSAVEQLLVLVVSSLPVVLLTFVYGSVDFLDLALLMLCFVVVAFFTGGIGMLFSALIRKSTFSNVCTYGVLLLIVVGTYMLNIFLLNMDQMKINNMVMQFGEIRPAADTGAAIYLMLINPVATFAEILGSQVSGGAGELSIRSYFGNSGDGLLATYWIPISLLAQSVISVLMIMGSIWALNPVKNDKK